ncbi:MAG: hypothetical protein O3B01_15910 [Planctomycetota bacterium]|nr:hypothetical protein [Planctomycetota bacterium]
MGTKLKTSHHKRGLPPIIGLILLAFGLTSCTPPKKKTTVEPDRPSPLQPLKRSGGIQFIPSHAHVNDLEILTPVNAREVVVPWQKFPGLIKPVSIDSRGQPLSVAIRKWSNDCGINVALHPKLLGDVPPQNFKLWLTVSGMRAEDALDWICRLTDSWYVVVEHGVFLVPDYRWTASDEGKVHIDMIGGLFQKRGDDLMTFLYSAFRPVLDKNKAFKIELWQASGQLVSVLPESSYENLARMIREIEIHVPTRGHQDQLPSTIILPKLPPPPPIRLSKDEFDQRFRRTMRAYYKDTDAQDILADIIDKTGINMAFDYRSIPSSRRELDINLGYVAASTVLNELSQRCYQKRLVIEPHRGIWIYPEKRSIDFGPTRHQAWQRVLFRSYPARDLGGGEFTPRKTSEDERDRSASDKLIQHVMRVIGGDWQEPAYAIGYSRPSGRLLVQHEVEAHSQIPNILALYRKATKVNFKPEGLKPPGG